MIEQTELNAEFADIEEMIRAAGDYLEVSEDLRPRTLEEARHNRRDFSTRTWFGALAAVIGIIALFASQHQTQSSSASPLNVAVSADCDQLYADAQQRTTQANVDASWTLVDSFRELRQRQASLLEDAF